MKADRWYPLALSRDIAAGTSAGTRVEAKELVVWRDDKGQSHVWIDRCPHRGMRMSFGFVRGDHIACLYHGWQYDTAGQCQYIPAHPEIDVPSTIRIESYASTEAGGIIWACLRPSEGEVPNFPHDLPADVAPLRSIFIDCPAARLTDFVSQTLIGEEEPKVEADSDGDLLTIALAGIVLKAAVQPLSDFESALHLPLERTPDAAQFRSVCRWAEELRRNAEAGVSTATSSEIAA